MRPIHVLAHIWLIVIWNRVVQIGSEAEGGSRTRPVLAGAKERELDAWIKERLGFGVLVQMVNLAWAMGRQEGKSVAAVGEEFLQT